MKLDLENSQQTSKNLMDTEKFVVLVKPLAALQKDTQTTKNLNTGDQTKKINTELK